ncbi:MAG: TonB-dependent receptor [Prevotella sp.]|nr:TonB-dependent receptor [Prevotella sp.]
MKKILFLALMAVMAMTAMAQNRTITGRLVDKETKEPMVQTTVQLLTADSTFVTGGVTNEKGEFSIAAPKSGAYLLKISSIGYITSVKKLMMEKDNDLAMGTVQMTADAIMLKETQVTAQALKVTVKEDTFIYNSAAYRTPEGSTIEELVKRLPGAQVDDDGKITINGKEVKKILVDGKEFMTGDTQTAMKNLPTSIVEKVKAYDEKSDLARVTGINDGNEETVLDFGLKKGMNKGFFSNSDVGVGTEDRYSARLMGARFNSEARVMGFASANNVSDRGFGGRGGGFGRGNNGLNSSKMLGANFNYEKKDVIKLNGSVRWNHNDGDQLTKNSSENFVSTAKSFGNSLSQNYSRSDSWNAQARVEWTPDTMTNIMFRPTFSHSSSDSRSASASASFADDPYLYVTDPLSQEAFDIMDKDSLMVNSRNNTSLSNSSSNSYGAMFQYNRKLGNKGRNVTVQLNAKYTDSDNKSLTTNNVHLYQITDALGNDSTYQTNRYNLTPSKNYNYSAQATYSEPLWKATFLQLSYKFTYSYSKSQRSTYDFSNMGENFFDGVSNTYRNWNGYLDRLGSPIGDYYDEELSRYSQYKNYTHDIELMFRMIREKFNFSTGVMLQPQSSDFTQDYQGKYIDTVRHVLNVAPTLDFRYRFNKVTNLRIRYRGTTSQPSMTDLVDITDDSNPLNITKGNPGLKPSFTNNLNATFRGYFEKTMQTVMANVRFSTTRNSVARKVTYDETTGGQTTRPENINGNWNLNGGLMFNTPLDSAGHWNVNTWSDASFANNVGYVSLDRKSDSQKNITKTLGINERLSGSYRNDWLEVELDGSLNYNHSRNKLQEQSNLDTWQFSYGANVNITLPWGTSLSTDIHEKSRRGYNDNSMNTNELVWNAQLSQGFLKGKPLVVMLQFYDILGQQSNFSRSINAMQRSDTEYNSINSYVMLHVNYKLNIFGSKEARQEMKFMDGPGMGPGGQRQRMGGSRRGGGGFGGPMMID